MSYFKRNEGALVFAFASVAFIAFYIVSFFIRRCKDRFAGEDTTEAEVSIGRLSSGRGLGLEAEVIHSFPSFVYSKAKGLELGKGVLECAVCLNAFNDDETLRLVSPCGHVFHAACVDIWLSYRSTCPICRANVVS